MSESWYELRVQTPDALKEALTDFLWRLPITGVEERALAELPAVLPETSVERSMLVAWLPPPDAEQAQAELTSWVEALRQSPDTGPLAHFISWEGDLMDLEPTTSAQSWRESLTALNVSPRLVITPAWLKHTRVGREQVVRIDPGEAFGDGRHETTRACLTAVDALFSGPWEGIPRLSKKTTVLDVGTGTGVLLLACLKLGAASGLGLEIDEEAAAVALENRDRNRLQRRARISLAPLEDVNERYELVIANILTQRVLEMRPQLLAHLKPGGVLMLSGIVWEQAPQVIAAYESEALRFKGRVEEGGWVALVFQQV